LLTQDEIKDDLGVKQIGFRKKIISGIEELKQGDKTKVEEKKETYKGPIILLSTAEVLYSLDLDGNLEELKEYKNNEYSHIIASGLTPIPWQGKAAFFYQGIYLLDYKDYSLSTVSDKCYQTHFVDYQSDELYGTADDWNNGPTQKLIKIEKKWDS